MITLLDATRLAGTKLRTRKIRTVTTILLASLLFGVLVAASLVMAGAFRSIEDFREDGLTSRYIVQVIPTGDTSSAQSLRRDPRLIAEAKKRYEALVEEKKSEAERLGLSYNQASDQPPYSQSRNDGEESLAVAAVDKTGIVHDLLVEQYKNKPVVDDVKLATTAREYSATNLFHSEYFDLVFKGSLDVLADGKEIFYDQSDETERNTNYVPPILDPTGIVFAPSEITEPFMLPNNAGWRPDGTSLPIILPQSTIERLLSRDAIPDGLSATERLDHLRQLRADAAALSFRACYRNRASLALIQQTI